MTSANVLHASAPLRANYDTVSELFDGATFLPGANGLRTEKLLEHVAQRRQGAFLALGLKISLLNTHLYHDTGFAQAIQMFLGASQQRRREITEYPPFRIWLRQCIRVTTGSSLDPTQLRSTLNELMRVLAQFDSSESTPGVLTIPGLSVQVTRFAVDPLLAQTSPPTYEFPNEAKQNELENGTAYTLPFFVEAATIAMDNIKKSWLAAYMDFDKFVKLIVHVTDGTFRSCSADRYSGVIFLSADDRTLLDLEESLIHEFGHQILYNVMELDPLVINKGETFKLPWSGSERDLYGYFHAFYIYLILMFYFERLNRRSKREERRAEKRMRAILKGLLKALPDFESSPNFTAKGQALFLSLKTEIHDLANRHKALIGEGR